MSRTAGRQRALLVFAKFPEPGKVKTRLIPELGEDHACRLYQAFLKDGIAQYSRLANRLEYDPYLFVTPSETVTFFEKKCETLSNEVGIVNLWRVRSQAEGDLGTRMKEAFSELFARKYESSWIIGTDHPTLPDVYIHDAFHYLDRYDAVIGPAEDGGYYGLGLRRRMDFLFEDMPWSTENVLTATRSRMTKNRVNYRQINSWYDVDEPADLHRLGRELVNTNTMCKHTMQWFEQHGMMYGR